MPKFLQYLVVLPVASFLFGSYLISANLEDVVLVSFGIFMMLPMLFFVFGNDTQGRLAVVSMLVIFPVIASVLIVTLGALTDGAVYREPGRITAWSVSFLSLFLAGAFTKHFFSPSTMEKKKEQPKNRNGLRVVK